MGTKFFREVFRNKIYPKKVDFSLVFLVSEKKVYEF